MRVSLRFRGFGAIFDDLPCLMCQSSYVVHSLLAERCARSNRRDHTPVGMALLFPGYQTTPPWQGSNRANLRVVYSTRRTADEPFRSKRTST
jgi:hypothetical protein